MNSNVYKETWKQQQGQKDPRLKSMTNKVEFIPEKEKKGNSEKMVPVSWYTDLIFFFFFFFTVHRKPLEGKKKKWIHKSLIVAVLTCYHNTSVSSRQLHKPHFCSHVILMHISIKVRDYIAHMTHLHPIPEEYHQGWGRLFIVHTIVLSVTPRA